VFPTGDGLIEAFGGQQFIAPPCQEGYLASSAKLQQRSTIGMIDDF
jgi:hypothetical protein